ncbi:Uma2 family endonuclease [Oscillatoria sp. CS-180]|uniref:Uma2 family endonuclease n=1 Tax=Oscillatoria sp. CS-180 TaxID=3021720 RepID=UPI00232D2BF1|nr:Uma2 family endonuclease [Oscillatoria sp. CS-180]MDB9526635.1 Uma2 family endonuclease [Oscillatoria sp. CS-180]
MYAIVSRQKTHLPAGTVMRMPGTWADYCALRESRGDDSIPRLKYRNGEILLMSPLPRHGREASVISDIVKILLDKDARNHESFTPITIDIPEEGGIEPDYCFYIDNWQSAVGKSRIDWQVDPPPDLAIEIDVATYTSAEDYSPYRVPEVWLFKRDVLKIYRLEDSGYSQQSNSLFFPDVDLPTLVKRVMQQALEQGTGAALRSLRQNIEAKG